jgi:hypothetical protein
MLTSFAPSPIAKVFASGYIYLTMITISAFYFGLTRQANTTEALSINFINILFNAEILFILTKLSPEIISAKSQYISSASLIYL